MPRPPQNRLELTFTDEDWAKLDKARGTEPRATHVKRIYFEALEQASPANPRERTPPTASTARAAVSPPVAPARTPKRLSQRQAELNKAKGF